MYNVQKAHEKSIKLWKINKKNNVNDFKKIEIKKSYLYSIKLLYQKNHQHMIKKRSHGSKCVTKWIAKNWEYIKTKTNGIIVMMSTANRYDYL